MKKSILSLALLLMLSSCAETPTPTASDKPVASPQVSDNFNKQLKESYTSLEGDVHFNELKSENVERFLTHGTGILFFSFPECPWCQQYLPLFNRILGENGMNAYYYNIYVDKTANAAFYDKIAAILEKAAAEIGENLIRHNNEGRAVIYMPLTLFVQDGRIAAFEGETNDISSKDHNPDTYWTPEKTSALQSRLQPSLAAVKALLAEKEKEGCENACDFSPTSSETK